MKILVTSFEPFDNDTLNSSQEALRGVPDTIDGAQIVKRDLPVSFGRSIEALRAAIQEEKPDMVLCVGQAGGRAVLTPERVAINIKDARCPDNDGAQPIDEPIFEDGPDAYFSTLPVRAMADAIRDAGLPAELSNTAGTFVCNQVMYGLLHILTKEFSGTRGGFLHLPCLSEQTVSHPDKPALPREELTLGIIASLRAIIQCAKKEQKL